MSKAYNLPEGVTVDLVDEYARLRINYARRESYARHPERVMRQRIISAANLLKKMGYLAEDQHASILEKVRGGGLYE